MVHAIRIFYKIWVYDLYRKKSNSIDDNTLRNENVENLTRSVLSRLQRGTNGWWLHVDLDVLSTDSLPAVDYPQPGGLNWEQLEKLTATALSTNSMLTYDGMSQYIIQI